MAQFHPHPEISLQPLSESDKALILARYKKKMIQGIFFFLIPFLLFISALVYINLHWESLGLKDEDTRGYLNLALAVLAIVPARLFASQLMVYGKEAKGWQKKIVRGLIHGVDGNTVFMGKLKLKLPEKLNFNAQPDDTIEAELSAVSGLVFRVTRITEEQAKVEGETNSTTDNA
jgi:hypothetical protein